MRKKGLKGAVEPGIETISLSGQTVVVYSPYGLACGWELSQCPYCCGIDADDSLKLGVNILSYLLMN